MIVGVPKEVKDQEYRVALTPATVKLLTSNGHRVLVQTGAGVGSNISDTEYQNAGAQIVETADKAWSADLVVKVKEPIVAEYSFFRPDLILFTFLHLASNELLTKALLSGGLTAIAYETIENETGQLPLLMPMSEVAGRMAAQVGAFTLQRNAGGRGVLMGGVPGVAPAEVIVLGGGSVGLNAARIAYGMGAHVTVLDINYRRLVDIDDYYRGQVKTKKSNQYNIEEVLPQADLVIGAVLIPGAKTPWLINRKMLTNMRNNAVIVDVSIDQGGCFETSKPTTHSQPTYEVDGIIHYCVANMPGAVPRTSTFALNNQTADYILALANKGINALSGNPGFLKGLNVQNGRLTHPAVAQAFNFEYSPPVPVL